MITVGRRCLSAEQGDQSQVGQPQEKGNREHGAGRDANLQQRIGENRTGDSGQETFCEIRAQCEAAHVSREHGGHGQLGGAEHDGELARPGGLIDQGSKPAQDETRAKQEQ